MKDKARTQGFKTLASSKTNSNPQYPRAGQVPFLQTLTSQITREAGPRERALLQRRCDWRGRLQGSAR